jgi:methylated-DNA-protein-cysteine methyltransferase-like protein
MRREAPAMTHAGPSFFDRVYEVVRQIPCGRVASYGQIAAILEHPRAARTVGWALSGLREGSDVPWQRVLNSRGCIATASATDPTGLQRRLLEAEGIIFNQDGSVDMRRFGWDERAIIT